MSLPVSPSQHPHADQSALLTQRAVSAYRNFEALTLAGNHAAAACALDHFNALWDAAHEFLCASIAAGEWKRKGACND